MADFDFPRILGETLVRHVEYRPEVSSTNDLAIELALANADVFPALTITTRQTGGRGRGANRWWATGGALTFSLTIDAAVFQLPMHDWPKMSLTIGLSVCETLEPLMPGRRIHLKWPNDVYLEGRKVCGVLVETIAQRPGLIVIGIGINVNNSFANAPAELRSIATSLADTANRNFELTSVLIRQLQQIEHRIASVVSNAEDLAESWRARCMLEGRTLSIDLGPKRVTGVCHGIDDEGALLVQNEGGVERVFAGVVTQIL
ncbi:MAG: biotin--[acetyl-CoA-carboxylase] ligase [Planctomycetaceae bacterium]|nr:biotin--[acetyl-CoA-carboxylase] ligase [Planctomycetales bacterium]MCB9925077.1 biotin--[acetyl-CoA-carboxylase] ligase [Planctomycetaceae bacterium]